MKRQWDTDPYYAKSAVNAIRGSTLVLLQERPDPAACDHVSPSSLPHHGYRSHLSLLLDFSQESALELVCAQGALDRSWSVHGCRVKYWAVSHQDFSIHVYPTIFYYSSNRIRYFTSTILIHGVIFSTEHSAITHHSPRSDSVNRQATPRYFLRLDQRQEQLVAATTILR